MKSLFVSITCSILLSQTCFASQEDLTSWNMVDQTVQTPQNNTSRGWFHAARAIIGLFQTQSVQSDLTILSTNHVKENISKHPSTHNITLLATTDLTAPQELPAGHLSPANLSGTINNQENPNASIHVDTDTTSIKKSSSFKANDIHNLSIEIDTPKLTPPSKSPYSSPAIINSHKKMDVFSSQSPRTPSSSTRTSSCNSPESSSSKYSLAAHNFAEASMKNNKLLNDHVHSEKKSSENLPKLQSTAKKNNYGTTDIDDTTNQSSSSESENSAWYTACLSCCRLIRFIDKAPEAAPNVTTIDLKESKKKSNLATYHDNTIRV